MKTLINCITAICILAILLFIAYGIKTRIFYSRTALEIFLNQFGIWAPIIFIFSQAVQVVLPILPGGIGLLGGVLIFGSVKGFLYNYIGICLGSIAAFLIAKRYGMPILEALFTPKMLKKYMKFAENKNFFHLFAIGIFMPIAPDDFLCYLAGTTKMTFKRFTIIILLGKPLAIAAYSFGLDVIFRKILMLIQ